MSAFAPGLTALSGVAKVRASTPWSGVCTASVWEPMKNVVMRFGVLSCSAMLLVACCKQSDKPCGETSAHQEPAVQKVMAKPEQAPVAVATESANATEKPTAEKLDGKVYGAGVLSSQTIKISDLYTNLAEYVGKRVRVEGPVVDVCSKRGCWFNMAADDGGRTLRFKVRDGVMVFPMSARGKYAVAEGVVRRIPLNLEQTRRVLAHEAEEKSQPFDPSTVTEPIVMVRLDGVGAVLRDKR